MFTEFCMTAEPSPADKAFEASSGGTEVSARYDKKNANEAAPENRLEARGPARVFPHTVWPDILRAAARDEAGAAEALGELCVKYRDPIFKWFLCHERSPERAEDLTQDFLLGWLSRDYLQFQPTTSSRFRCFLVSSLRNYMRDEWDRQKAQKRGGGVQNESLDAWLGEILDPHASASSQSCVDKDIAFQVHHTTLETLREDYKNRGKGDRYEKIQPFVFDDNCGVTYADLAASLGLTIPHARQEVRRFRYQYFECFEKNVSYLVGDNGQELDEEVRYLVSIVLNAELHHNL
jgi:RNA polymerase sigma-70 factor (ECF subfamily)